MKNIDSLNNSVKQILYKKELSGLKNQNISRLVLFIFFSPAAIILAHANFFEKTVSVGVVLFGIISSIYFLWKLRSSSNLRVMAYLGITLDFLMLVFMSYTWILSMGGGDIPIYLTFRSSAYFIAILFLSITTLSLKPQYSIYSSILFSGYFTLLLLITITNSNTVFANSYLEGFTTSKFHLELELTKLLFLYTTCYVVIIATKKNRETIIEASLVENQRDQLGRYFSPKVAKQISENPIEAGGKVQDVAILFSDIRNFTSICEEKEPNEILDFLSQYHDVMVEIIFQNNGTLDKFIGDAIMATFGTPHRSPGDAYNALNAAKQMNEALINLNRQRTDQDLFTIEHGVGIHFGSALVGNIGSKQRLEYTVLGDSVNIASRVESLCKEQNTNLLFTKELLFEVEIYCEKNNLPQFSTAQVGEFTVKGKTLSLGIFTLQSEVV